MTFVRGDYHRHARSNGGDDTQQADILPVALLLLGSLAFAHLMGQFSGI